VVGHVPFSGNSIAEIFENILKKPLTFPDGGIHLSSSFLDFCEGLLCKSTCGRLRVKEALNHDWLNSKNRTGEKVPVEVLRRSSKTERNDRAIAVVHSLVSASYVYRIGSGIYILGTGPYLEDICEGTTV